jgi:hypothetical protein
MKASNLQVATRTNHSVTSNLPPAQPQSLPHQITRTLLLDFGSTECEKRLLFKTNMNKFGYYIASQEFFPEIIDEPTDIVIF